MSALFDEANKLEPEYYYQAEQLAHNLLPQWFGGDPEYTAFNSDISTLEQQLKGNEDATSVFAKLGDRFFAVVKRQSWTGASLKLKRREFSPKAGTLRTRSGRYFYFKSCMRISNSGVTLWSASIRNFFSSSSSIEFECSRSLAFRSRGGFKWPMSGGAQKCSATGIGDVSVFSVFVC